MLKAKRSFFMNIDFDILENLEKMQGATTTEQPNGSTSSPAPSTPSASENCFLDGWTTIYDKTSEDPAINLGFTAGIYGNAGDLTNLPDLTPYKMMRVQFFASDSTRYFYLDISDKTDNMYRLRIDNLTGMTFFVISFAIAVRNNKAIMSVGNCTRIVLSTSKYPATTNYSKNATVCHIKKIDVK